MVPKDFTDTRLHRFKYPWTYFSQRQDNTKIKDSQLNSAENFKPVSTFEGGPTVTPLDDYQLPGQGTPREDCGQLHWFGCSDCGHTFQAERKCDQKTCPNCWRRWAFKLGKRAGMRLWAARKMIMGRRRGRLVHVVISMKYEGGEIADYRRRAYRCAIAHQLCGGVAVLHHTRVDKGDGMRIPDGYIHYHIIGLAKRGILPGKEGSTLFHVIRDPVGPNDRGNRPTYNGFQRTREVIACLSYLLTHAAVKPRSSTTTWFGEVSYNKLSNERLKEEFPDMMDFLGKSGRKCPCCDGNDCHSMWDAELWAESTHKRMWENVPQPAYALERYGVEIC